MQYFIYIYIYIVYFVKYLYRKWSNGLFSTRIIKLLLLLLLLLYTVVFVVILLLLLLLLLLLGKYKTPPHLMKVVSVTLLTMGLRVRSPSCRHVIFSE